MIRKVIRSILRYGSNEQKTSHHFKKSKRSFKEKQQPVHINSINKIILEMVNNERKKRHLQPVAFDHSFELHAIRWSKHMAHIQKLCHSGTILENACMVPSHGSSNTITKAMYFCWKKSPPHWGWMMNPGVTKAGFGFSIRGKFAYGAYAFNNP
jgi:uncharacterized protein YkwD